MANIRQSHMVLDALYGCDISYLICHYCSMLTNAYTNVNKQIMRKLQEEKYFNFNNLMLNKSANTFLSKILNVINLNARKILFDNF